MENRTVIFIVLILHNVATEIFKKKKISVFKNDEVHLLLPHHQPHDIVSVTWKKGMEVIATIDQNVSLSVPDPEYSEILQVSPDASLIIRALSWEDGEEYSADVKLANDEYYSVTFELNKLNTKYIQDTGPEKVSARVGENVTLSWTDGDIKRSEINEIDWLTERWVYFAVTRVDEEINILEPRYLGHLSSTQNGSLVFTQVTKRVQGMYRANILSSDGRIFEQTYDVYISDHFLEHEEDILDMLTYFNLVSLTIYSSILVFIVLIVSLLVRIIYKKKTKAAKVTKRRRAKGEQETSQDTTTVL